MGRIFWFAHWQPKWVPIYKPDKSNSDGKTRSDWAILAYDFLFKHFCGRLASYLFDWRWLHKVVRVRDLLMEVNVKLTLSVRQLGYISLIYVNITKSAGFYAGNFVVTDGTVDSLYDNFSGFSVQLRISSRNIWTIDNKLRFSISTGK